MEINQENKFKRNLKKFGSVALVCVFVVAVALAIGFGVANNIQPVSAKPLEFGVPMNNAQILKNYSEGNLQRVEGANMFAIHLSMDFASADNNVLAVCDGVVSKVDTDTQDGTVIEIEHADGFVSVYASLSNNTNIKEGDVVKKGQKIGEASRSAGFESGLNCDHLHFTLFKDGIEVDPNNYLDLQNK